MALESTNYQGASVKSSLAFIVIPFCLLGACSKVKKLDDMAKATDHMEATTKQMAENTGNTGTMYEQIRSKETAATRLQEYENLQKKTVLMQSKISSAAIYFMSQEYQLATEDEVLRKPEIMTDLKKAAANDFVRKLGDLYSQINLKKLDPTKDISHHNEEAMFNALASAIHFNHDYQEHQAKKLGIPTVSFYDIVKGALRKDKLEMDARANGRGVNHGVSYEVYERILMTGDRKEMLIELIKARVDMLAATGLHYMSNKAGMNLEQTLEGLAFLVSQGYFGKIDLPLTINNSNTATRDSVIEALDGALKAKRFLENELGIKKKLVKTIQSAYKQIHLDGDRELENIQKRIDELVQ